MDQNLNDESLVTILSRTLYLRRGAWGCDVWTSSLKSSVGDKGLVIKSLGKGLFNEFSVTTR